MAVNRQSLARALAVACLTLPCWVAACSSFSGAEPAKRLVDSGDEQQHPEDAEPSRDAAREGDAAAPDASFCSGANWVCDDFDDPPATWPSPPWDGIGVTKGATLAIVSGGVAEATLAVDAGPVSATLHRAAGGGFKGFRCSFKVYVVEGAGVTDLLDVRISRPGAADYRVSFSHGPGVGKFFLNGLVTSLPALPKNTWNAIVLDISAAGGAHLSVGGAEQLGAMTPDFGNVSGADLTLGIGQSFSVSTPWRVRFDDVRCDAR